MILPHFPFSFSFPCRRLSEDGAQLFPGPKRAVYPGHFRGILELIIGEGGDVK